LRRRVDEETIEIEPVVVAIEGERDGTEPTAVAVCSEPGEVKLVTVEVFIAGGNGRTIGTIGLGELVVVTLPMIGAPAGVAAVLGALSGWPRRGGGR
jgi:hypothetical protein